MLLFSGVACAATGPALAADGNSALIETFLDDRGIVQVRETLELHEAASAGVLERVLTAPPGARIILRSAVRVSPDGRETPLSPLDVRAGPNGIVDTQSRLRWALGDPGVSPVRIRIEYELAGVLHPAWDFPRGPGVQRARDAPGLHNPLLRGREMLATWRDVAHCLERCVRLDHDIRFPPGNGRPVVDTEDITYRLDYAGDWRPLFPDRDPTIVAGDHGQRVQLTFDHLGSGPPPGVAFVPALIRVGSIVALPIAGLALILFFTLARIPRWARRHIIDRERFEREVVAVPPELVTTWLHEYPPEDAFARMLERLVAQGRLEMEVLRPGTETVPARVRLRLLTDPDTLHPLESQLLQALFGTSGELRSDLHRARHRGTGFDPDRITATILQQTAFAGDAAPRPRPLRPAVTALLLGSGLALAALDVLLHRQWPVALTAGVLGLLVMAATMPTRWWHPLRSALAALYWLIPLTVLTAIAVLMHLATDRPLSPASSAGLALILLSGLHHSLAGTRGFDPALERRHRMRQAREWARRQLQSAQPELSDTWRFHLDALGLSRELHRWRRRHLPRESGDALEPATAPAFSADLPTLPTLPEAWTRAFHVPVQDDDRVPF
ncbi:hypothetical protein TVNIR_1176 [Thioalkalivibrio nitratireducens DSM 14787]|uniref:DUF2207 domain-containing protein n=1 Tax=Thioalkalivibrio nitratireducens (strain DSM 14787 / UNIQEM 213 / ALEN2) TaxID=1255043 RepID=L0DWW2_THIND|nr:hypothetical protein TVNIR_1176 [Thioalkalivibrio nitratireducens DSM 14787]